MQMLKRQGVSDISVEFPTRAGHHSTVLTASLPSATLDDLSSEVMSSRLSEAGENVPQAEIIHALKSLEKELVKASSSPLKQSGFVSFSSVGRFRLWRDFSGAGIIDTDSKSGSRVSLETHSLEKFRIVQVKALVEGKSWELHDLPKGAAARTQIRLGSDSRLAYVGRESHYSYGRRWDPSPQKASENFYYESGKIKCVQRFCQGTARARGDNPVFEGYREDGSLLVVEYGDSLVGKHRPKCLGPAYQEFYPSGSSSLVVFAENGKQLGDAIRLNPDGTVAPAAPTPRVPSCKSITNAESWVTEMDARGIKPFGQALIEAISSHIKPRKPSHPPNSRNRAPDRRLIP